MPPQRDILDQPERLRGSLFGSLALHASLAASFFAFTWVGSRHPRENWGYVTGGGMGSVAVNVVPRIPLPSRSGPINPVAHDTESVVPEPPAIISLVEANEAATLVQELAGDSANIIFGAMYDDTNPDTATITVIATGLDGRSKELVKTPEFLRRPTTSPIHTTPAKPEVSINRSFTTSNPYSQSVTSQTVQPTYQTDPNRRPILSQPGKAPANTNTDPSGIKIPEFLQKNRHNK